MMISSIKAIFRWKQLMPAGGSTEYLLYWMESHSSSFPKESMSMLMNCCKQSACPHRNRDIASTQRINSSVPLYAWRCTGMRRRCKYNLIKHFCCAVICYWCRGFLDSHGCCSCIGCVVFVKSVQCIISIRGGYAITWHRWHTCQLSFKEVFGSTGDYVCGESISLP